MISPPGVTVTVIVVVPVVPSVGVAVVLVMPAAGLVKGCMSETLPGISWTPPAVDEGVSSHSTLRVVRLMARRRPEFAERGLSMRPAMGSRATGSALPRLATVTPE